MRLFAGFYAVALGSLTWASMAHAETGTLLQKAAPAAIEKSANGGVAFRRVIDQYAACLAHKRRLQVSGALRMPSASREQQAALHRLTDFDQNTDANCLANGKMNLETVDLRGSLYAALVRATYDDNAATLPAQQRDFVNELQSAGAEQIVVSTAQLLNFAGCVIHRDSQNARLAVLGPAGSQREAAAFTALSPIFGQCLVAGNTIKFDKANLVGLIAEAYYREAGSVNLSGIN